MHTIKVVKGAFVMVNHENKDQDEAFAVDAILSGKNRVRCHELKKFWVEGGWGDYKDNRNLVKWRRNTHNVGMDKLEAPGANGKAIKRRTADSLHGRSSPKAKLRREMQSQIEGHCRMTLYHRKGYYCHKVRLRVVVGKDFEFRRAKHTRPGNRECFAHMQLPWNWRREVAQRGLAVVDGHFVVRVLEELQSGYRVLAVRLVRHQQTYNETPTTLKQWNRKLLSEKPEDLQMAYVVPVIAEAMAYKQPRTDKLMLVWAVWKPIIRAQEES